jgi:L-seryl-tRNA(Ser) seleniumtransferase
VGLRHPDLGADELDRRLRAADPPIIGRIDEGELLLDVRTIFEDQVDDVARAATLSLRC